MNKAKARVDFKVVFEPEKRKYRWRVMVTLPALGYELNPLFVNPKVKILGLRLQPNWGVRNENGRFALLESGTYFIKPEQAHRRGIKVAEGAAKALQMVVAQNSAAFKAAESFRKFWDIEIEKGETNEQDKRRGKTTS